jgi:hypothetical protein
MRELPRSDFTPDRAAPEVQMRSVGGRPLAKRRLMVMSSRHSRPNVGRAGAKHRTAASAPMRQGTDHGYTTLITVMRRK